MKVKTLFLSAVASVLVLSANSFAMPILSGGTADNYTWTASDGEGRSASAVFSYTGNTLSIVLTNLGDTGNKVQPNELLAGLFFEYNGGTLTNPHVSTDPSNLHVSASDLPRADGVVNDGNLDGEYGFIPNIDEKGVPYGNYGISNTAFDPADGPLPLGFDGFGNHIIDEGVAYPQYNTPNGPSFGIVPGDFLTLADSITSYITDWVLITFTLDGGFDPEALEQVNFLYGTDYDVAPVPEPATVLLFGAGLVGLAGLSRRKMRT